MAERGKAVCMAKLAEQAERYDGTVKRDPSLGFLAPCLCCVQCVCS